MVLDIRQKQRDGILRMLHFNEPPSVLKKREAEETASPYKILVLDSFSKSIIAPLVGVQDLRQKGGVTLHLVIDSQREAIPDVPAVYFVQATPQNVQRIVEDADAGLYDCLHLNFTSSIPRPLLDSLAEGTVSRRCAQQIAKVYDQHLAFIALESNMFSLGMSDTYLRLNDPAARDTEIEASTSAVVEGLFSAIATMGVVPIIRCPKGGAAQHVAEQLERRIREHLKMRNNLFSEAAAGMVSALTRPLLCLFDRNFELSVVLQHSWTYKPLVHDAFSMDLNRITIEEPNLLPGAPPSKKSFEVGDDDFFWQANGRSQFPQVAAESDRELSQYKQAINEINQQTGSHMDPSAEASSLMQDTTQGLMAAVSRLPQLLERKRTIEKHTNLLHHLLRVIRPPPVAPSLQRLCSSVKSRSCLYG